MALPGLEKPTPKQIIPRPIKMVEAFMKGNTSKEPSFNDIAVWWRHEYENYYNQPIHIGFNIFDATKSIKSVYEYLNIDMKNFIKEMSLWFDRYDKLGYSNNIDFPRLTIFTFKREHMINSLYKNIPAKRKKSDSYLKNGNTRGHANVKCHYTNKEQF